MIGHRRPPFIFALLAVALSAIYAGVLLGARAGTRPTQTRGPASLTAQMNVVELPCWDRDVGGPQTIGARYVRLTGRACGRGRGADGFSVRNLTNGFEATIFASGRGLTTDYIPLAAGGNDVVIAFGQGRDAHVERRLRLTR